MEDAIRIFRYIFLIVLLYIANDQKITIPFVVYIAYLYTRLLL